MEYTDKTITDLYILKKRIIKKNLLILELLVKGK